MDRSYTVKEIDELRYVCSIRFFHGTCYFSDARRKSNDAMNEVIAKTSDNINRYIYTNNLPSNEIRQAEKVLLSRSEQIVEVEMLIRTYMLAGITAQQIQEQDKQKSIEQESKQST